MNHAKYLFYGTLLFSLLNLGIALRLALAAESRTPNR